MYSAQHTVKILASSNDGKHLVLISGSRACAAIEPLYVATRLPTSCVRHAKRPNDAIPSQRDEMLLCISWQRLTFEQMLGVSSEWAARPVHAVTAAHTAGW